MSNMKKLLVACMIGALCGLGVLAITVAIGALVSSLQRDFVISVPKDSTQDAFAQGNAPFGGGRNEDSGPGELLQSAPLYPPMEARINPGPPMDFDLNDCGIAAITLVVKKDSSVWETVALPYGHRGDAFLVGVVTALQEFVDAHPSILVRDVDVVPPGFEFVVSYDGSAIVNAT